MADPLYFVQGDTMPQIQLVLTDNITQAPKNLTDKTVMMHVKPSTGNGARFSREAIYQQPTDRENGIAYIQWQDGDLNRPAGDYIAEIEIYDTISTGRETIYETIKIVLREDIGDITPLPSSPTSGDWNSAPDPT